MLMKNFTLIISSFLFTTTLLAQTTLNLRPDATLGKDAYYKDATPTLNQGTHADFTALAWTNGGAVVARSIIEFDLTSIPAGSTINSAYLSLYNNSTSSNNSGEHSNLSGSNSATLRRITTSWNEFSVTWNNQPSATNSNEVVLPASTTIYEDYTNINVTQLVQDMVDMPGSSFGFMISLQTEQYYRALIFSSSDHADPNNHPELVITYTLPSAISELNSISNLLAYPNPSVGNIMVELLHSENEPSELKLFDQLGKLIRTVPVNQLEKINIERNDLPAGIYFLSQEINGIVCGRTKLILQ